MLETVGARSMDDLLVDIPQSLRLDGLQLPNGLSEFETMAQVTALAARNKVYPDRLTFRGGGVYRRFIPSAVAPSYSEAFETSSAVSSAISVWNSKIACSVPWLASAWYGVYAV